MSNYNEQFKNITFRPCELVAIRTIAEDYRNRLFEIYKVKDQKELRKYLSEWSEYEEVQQYYDLIMCNQIIKKIPKLPDEILEQGFLVEADVAMEEKEKE